MRRELWIILILTASAALLRADSAQASGPGTGGRRIRLDDEPAGSYLVTVVTSPTPPVAKNLYLEIRVKDAQSDRVISGGTVYTHADPVGFDAPRVEAEANHDIAPVPIDFASHLPVSQPGNWEITIDIDGPSGKARVSFALLVPGAARASDMPWGAIATGGLVIAGLAIYLQASNRLKARGTGKPDSG